jgi:outer membrane protein OmpA-like peptidoglycan-associated protein
MSTASAAIPDLLGLVTRQLSPEVIRRAASWLGEDQDRTARAVSASVPSVLTALSDVASSPSGASHLGDVIEQGRRLSSGELAQGGSVDGSVIGRADGAASVGARLFDDELGAHSSQITDAVAGSSGITRDSAHKLLGGVTAVALAAIGKNVSGPAALGTALREQRGDWVRRLPGPLASLFGASPAVAAGRHHPDRTIDTGIARAPGRVPPVAAGPGRSWIFPAVLAAIALLGFGLFRGMLRPHPVVRQARVEQIAPATAARVPVQLPDGRTLSLAPGSAVYELASFLGSAGGAPPRRFTLAPMNFDFGSTQPTTQSMSTLNELAAVLRAYPSATVRIESFTDNIGSPEANKALSVSRSDAVKDLLAARGVRASNIEAVGLGQDHPIASNDTDLGRAANRRTDVVVTGR